MSDQNLKLVVVLGSVREGRFGAMIAEWFTGEVRRHGRFDLDVLDLAEVTLPVALPADPDDLKVPGRRPAELAALAGRLAGADAFVVVTPEYNHSFPASIKHLIDWHFTEWQAKPVGFVSYGGMGGGLRAVEHLRGVFAEMHAVTVRHTVSFDRPWERFGADERPVDPDGPGGAAKMLLDQLGWWGSVLHDARLATPYTH
ncbi:NADPH-dependent FMN reductase [Nonomuraea cavernae]|uniref:NADPH-dependent FMN reductase n=1 Tax=Nonomuraea cavernae TaxID=2045107 RepID=UPI0033FF285E